MSLLFQLTCLLLVATTLGLLQLQPAPIDDIHSDPICLEKRSVCPPECYKWDHNGCLVCDNNCCPRK
ncbi:hypothetical protein BaRGS_00030090, partial [Batillaria attramentaria]